jgi:adenylate cyclase
MTALHVSQLTMASQRPPVAGRPAPAGLSLRSLKQSDRRDVVVLCADLRGFKHNSQMLSAHTVLAMLDTFCSRMNEIIECNGGVIVNIQGDTLLAAFGVRGGVEGAQCEALRQAITCAHQMQAGAQAMADQWAEEFGLRTALGIGLNSGEAVVGLSGTADLQRYTVFGDCVELALRFMHRARAGEIVFSAAVNKALQDSCALTNGVTNSVTNTEALPEMARGGLAPIELFGITIETRLDFT